MIDFVHQVDLLETVLMRFEVQAQMSLLALQNLRSSDKPDWLAEQFWVIDIEETFASSALELGYQVKNGWGSLARFAQFHEQFAIFSSEYEEPCATFLARHKATHFRPDQFLKLDSAKDLAILRRPYYIENGEIKKELARVTLPKLAQFIRSAFIAVESYISIFHRATVAETSK